MLAVLLTAILALWLLTAVALDIYGHRPIPPGQWDAIVVPGCAVRPDGTPSLALQRRVQHAGSAYEKGMAPRIVTTGGVGRYPPSEASVAAAFAVSLGVPKEALLEESMSCSTRENAAMAAELQIDGKPIYNWNILVLSDGYHAWRCHRLFKRHFAQVTARGSVPGPRLRIRGALREVASILKFLAHR